MLGTNDETVNIKNTFVKAFEEYQQNNIANSNNIEYDNVNGKIQKTNPRDIRTIQDIDTLYRTSGENRVFGIKSQRQRLYDSNIKREFNNILQEQHQAYVRNRELNDTGSFDKLKK